MASTFGTMPEGVWLTPPCANPINYEMERNARRKAGLDPETGKPIPPKPGECTLLIWLEREVTNTGPACCLKHFMSGGRGGSRRPRCKADRRCVEDCESD